MIMKLEQGIYIGLGMTEYHAWHLDKANLKAGPVSSSMLKQFALNPYAWLRSEDKPPTAAMQTGSLLDAALTEPETLADRVAINPFDSYRTKESREWRDEQLDAGRIICAESELENATKCADAVREHEVAGQILSGAQFQVGAVADFGCIPVKCLVDIVPGLGSEWEETLVDYKTTAGGLDDEAIRKTMGNFRYHFQAAFYRSVYNKASADRVCDDFAFIFQDPQTREVRVVKLARESLALGTRSVKHALTEFAKAAERGIRSRYAKSATELDLMPYHSMNEEEYLINNGH